MNVPFIVADGHALKGGGAGSGTGRVASPGRTSSALVQTVDLFATAGAIAKAACTTGSDSVSLIPLLEGTASSVRSYPLTEAANDVAIRGPLYKLVVHGSAGTCELFKLTSDRWEQTDLLADGKSLSEKLVLATLLSEITTLSGRTESCP